MLVLSRKEGESIVIDDHIIVKVSRIKGGDVRLAIIAPDNVRVDRAEVHYRRNRGEPTEFGEGLLHNGLEALVSA